MDIIRQSACRVVPVTVYSYGFLFNFTTMVQASDPDPDLKFPSLGWDLMPAFGWVQGGSI